MLSTSLNRVSYSLAAGQWSWGTAWFRFGEAHASPDLCRTLQFSEVGWKQCPSKTVTNHRLEFIQQAQGMQGAKEAVEAALAFAFQPVQGGHGYARCGCEHGQGDVLPLPLRPKPRAGFHADFACPCQLPGLMGLGCLHDGILFSLSENKKNNYQ
jgi:hypothetical protein